MCVIKDLAQFGALVVCVIIVGLIICLISTCVFLYIEGFYGKQTFEKTIHIDKLVDGKQLKSNPGFIDSDGVGYIDLTFNRYRIFLYRYPFNPYHIGGEYNITYFCDDNNLRKVVLIKEVPTPIPTLTPTPIPTLDVFKCVNVSGTCK